MKSSKEKAKKLDRYSIGNGNYFGYASYEELKKADSQAEQKMLDVLQEAKKIGFTEELKKRLAQALGKMSPYIKEQALWRLKDKDSCSAEINRFARTIKLVLPKEEDEDDDEEDEDE